MSSARGSESRATNSVTPSALRFRALGAEAGASGGDGLRHCALATPPSPTLSAREVTGRCLGRILAA